jgi:hypothetical protein
VRAPTGPAADIVLTRAHKGKVPDARDARHVPRPGAAGVGAGHPGRGTSGACWLVYSGARAESSGQVLQEKPDEVAQAIAKVLEAMPEYVPPTGAKL